MLGTESLNGVNSNIGLQLYVMLISGIDSAVAGLLPATTGGYLFGKRRRPEQCRASPSGMDVGTDEGLDVQMPKEGFSGRLTGAALARISREVKANTVGTGDKCAGYFGFVGSMR